MKKFYLAYGSNLNVEQMRFRCPDARIVGTAEIPNCPAAVQRQQDRLLSDHRTQAGLYRSGGSLVSVGTGRTMPLTAMRGIPISTTKRNWNFPLQKPEKS